ncbi:MAG: hypothetical protein O2909_10250 [Chloroflexi bacterium]|nr:hypothetical protein [Chloroflexota bacterium]MDA1219809.1 hypothetical protein [Chloroflexota bacterium]
MPIIDHRQVPEVPWRPGYRKGYMAGHGQGVTSTLSTNIAELLVLPPALEPYSTEHTRFLEGVRSTSVRD